MKKVLVYGVGNPSRGDDGLGPALAAEIEALGMVGIVVDANYQLTVEDAAEIAEYAVVVFVDAAVAGPAPFWFRRIDDTCLRDARLVRWSSHSVGPAQVVALARELFHSDVRAYTLGIRGYEFGDLQEGFSQAARSNLDEASRFVRSVLADRTFDSYVQEPGHPALGVPPAA